MSMRISAIIANTFKNQNPEIQLFSIPTAAFLSKKSKCSIFLFFKVMSSDSGFFNHYLVRSFPESLIISFYRGREYPPPLRHGFSLTLRNKKVRAIRNICYIYKSVFFGPSKSMISDDFW